MLADLGADVVKVEPPDGDLLRTWGDQTDGLSGYFNQQNVSKRDISIDLKAPGARELLLQLVAKADVVVENYRPGVMAKFGLDYEACTLVNPALVYLSISGFGQTSSWKHRAAYAPIIHAEIGLIDRQARGDDAEPTNPILSIADTNAALHGLVGLLSALWMREQTGKGQHIDLSMMAAMAVTDDYAHWALDRIPFRPLGGEVRPTRNGHIMISGDLRSTWFQLNGAGLVEDGLPKGASVDEKITARNAAINTWLASFETNESLQAKLTELNIAWGDVRSSEDMFDSDISAELGLAAEVDYPSGPRRVAQAPYRFSDAESGIRHRAPYRGEHNQEVLADWLGTEAPDTQALIDANVLLADVPDPTPNVEPGGA